MRALFNNRCGYTINSFDGLPTTCYNKHCYYLKCVRFANIFWVIFFEIESTLALFWKTSAQNVKIMHHDSCLTQIANKYMNSNLVE